MNLAWSVPDNARLIPFLFRVTLTLNEALNIKREIRRNTNWFQEKMLNFQIYTTFNAAEYKAVVTYTHRGFREILSQKEKLNLSCRTEKKVFLLALNHYRLYNRATEEWKKENKTKQKKQQQKTHSIHDNKQRFESKEPKYILSSPRTVASVEKRFVISLVDRDILVRSDPFYLVF